MSSKRTAIEKLLDKGLEPAVVCSVYGMKVIEKILKNKFPIYCTFVHSNPVYMPCLSCSFKPINGWVYKRTISKFGHWGQTRLNYGIN